MSYFNHKWKSFLNESKNTTNEDVRYGTTKRGKSVPAKKVGKKTLSIPYPKISDSWGEPGTKDRAEAELLLRRVATGNTWEDKIDSLNNFAESCKNNKVCLNSADSTILSRLMALDVLASIVYDFDPSSAGLLFEAFLATLLGSDSKKIAAAQSRAEGESGDIADVYLLGKPFSLKLVKDSSSSIKGSYADLVGSVIRNQQPMTYMIALKALEGDTPVITFHEFTIGTSAIVEDEEGNLIHDPKSHGSRPDLAGFIDVDDPKLKVVKGTQFYVPLTFLKEKGSVQGTKRRKAAFAAKRKSYQKDNKAKTLNIGSKESLKALAEAYAEKISQDIVVIYDALDTLSQNINGYLIGNKLSAGKAATEDAKAVASKTEKLVKEKENK